ncbi:N-acetyllactosaminide beta-1,6-N-acetylglucosaminyl-transferase-like [Ruditapes philippinarum]|uniref:N-acetyllactosaminide beta-1,6-N-acetylglucosaminyl-transferase-like n=1 Tax=Ruditapes philippinarum TaxID=129788 RepID=UPI00295AC622|nr:N-acetyllactosaminide beta-1,6-N-acetylglucosaminyl-transferase-like [Ruditapes philippinarum]
MSGANRVRKIVTQDLPSWTIYKYKEKTRNCSSFIDERGYITHHLTTEEQQFPIAFSILMYKNVEQVERLLRAIYRPQNIYCIHVDSKTNIEIYKALSGISNCFENVFVLRKRVNVIWGKMSVLTPELLCMEELWKRHKTWKYFINLTGQEFPLKSYPETTAISNTKKPYLARFKNRLHSRMHRWPCHGKWVRGMCIFNFKDLHTLSTRKELFANKFHLYDNPLPYACMEELIFNRTRDEFQGTRKFDASWYSNLGFVKRHV